MSFAARRRTSGTTSGTTKLVAQLVVEKAKSSLSHGKKTSGKSEATFYYLMLFYVLEILKSCTVAGSPNQDNGRGDSENFVRPLSPTTISSPATLFQLSTNGLSFFRAFFCFDQILWPGLLAPPWISGSATMYSATYSISPQRPPKLVLSSWAWLMRVPFRLQRMKQGSCRPLNLCRKRMTWGWVRLQRMKQRSCRTPTLRHRVHHRSPEYQRRPTTRVRATWDRLLRAVSGWDWLLRAAWDWLLRARERMAPAPAKRMGIRPAGGISALTLTEPDLSTRKVSEIALKMLIETLFRIPSCWKRYCSLQYLHGRRRKWWSFLGEPRFSSGPFRSRTDHWQTSRLAGVSVDATTLWRRDKEAIQNEIGFFAEGHERKRRRKRQKMKCSKQLFLVGYGHTQSPTDLGLKYLWLGIRCASFLSDLPRKGHSARCHMTKQIQINFTRTTI